MFYYKVNYTSGDKYFFQGNKSELKKEMKRSKSYIAAGSCGSYQLRIPAHGYIIEINTDTGSCRQKNPKDFIRDHYNLKRVSENSFYRLKDDLEKGIVRFDDIY